jgi:hypothetical protein
MRDFRQGQELAPAARFATEQYEDLEDTLMPIKNLFAKVGMYISGLASGAMNWIVKALKLDELAKYLGDKVDEVAGNTKKDEGMLLSDWLKTVADTTKTAIDQRQPAFRPLILPRN